MDMANDIYSTPVLTFGDDRDTEWSNMRLR
jgi:hypothetical protein